MDQKTANQLDRMLADGELSGPEADAIFDRVYREVARQDASQRPWQRAPRWLWGGIAAAAGVTAVIAVGLPGGGTRPSADHGEFTARGSASGAIRIDVMCSEGDLAACPTSAKLVFLVAGDEAGGFLSAYAEPLESGAERVWYFSRASDSPRVAPSSVGTRAFDRGVLLQGTHRPGRYRVHAFLADHPLEEREMRGGSPSGLRARTVVEFEVVED
jgi:hypothetical protein